MKYLVLLLLILTFPDTYACSCTPPKVQDAYNKPKVVIVAKVIREEVFSKDHLEVINEKTEEVEAWPGMNGYLVEVSEVLKGRVKLKTFWILSSRMSCGASLRLGSTYLMYLAKSKQMNSSSSDNYASLITGYCHGTKDVESPQAKLDLDYLKN